MLYRYQARVRQFSYYIFFIYKWLNLIYKKWMLSDIFVSQQIEDIFALMFADYVASFSDTIIRLQHQINCIERFCLSVGMHLNLLKTKIIVYRNGGVLKQIEKWFYMREVVDVVSFYKYLGIYFTLKLIWSKTKDVLALQASMAVFKIFQYQYQFGQFCPKDIFKLFDSIVKPFLCYGSEIWGYEYSQKIEKVHIKFCKRYACLHQNTADYFVLSECGRYPLAVIYMTQCVKYWVRLTQMRNYRYPKQCYNMLRSLASSGKINWASNVRLLLYKHGFGYVWEADTIGDASRFINLFRQRLADCFTQQWHSEVEESPKALHYKHFKLILEVEPYLKIDLPFVYRKVLANFRCSSHSLMIEAGRHQNIDRNLRFCQMCLKRNVYIVEDEFHFFLVCPAFDDIRELYFKPEWKNALTTKQTFYNIMSSNAKLDILSVSKYLLCSFSLRKELLNTVKLIYNQSK